MTLRPIPVIDLGRVKPVIVGEPGRIVDAPLSSLVVDGTYQRVFQPRSEQRVRSLCAQWDWKLYTPIIIAPAGQQYAIVDGQHRAAAALALEIHALPAWLTQADEKAQARAFIAINASPTRVDTLQLWHSRHAAGDYDAVMLWDVCKRAGIEISRHPVAAAFRQPNVTLCPGVINDLRTSCGVAPTVKTLEIVTAIGKAQEASLLTRNILRAVSRLVTGPWEDLPADAIAAGLAEVDFAKVIAQAGVDAKDRREPIIDCLVAAIGERLTQALEALDERAAAE